MSKAIIWVRSSTTKQECETQRDELVKIAVNEYHFKKSDLIFIGKVGASAIKLNKVYQQEVDQLLKAVNEISDLSTIFVWETSRLARNEKAFYAMKDEICKKKIQLICNVPKIKLLEDNGEINQGMEITLNLLVTLAKQEMEIKKKRFARGKHRNAEEGKYNGGAIPFGYRVDRTRDNLIVIDDEDCKIVKEIFDRYENGMTQPKLARYMALTGRGNVTISMINNILNNESYCGVKRKSASASYERAYPPIITTEQFQRCRKIAKSNNTTANKAKNIYYAEHLVICQTCGGFWSASGSKNSYHCSAASKANSIWKYDNHRKEKCTNKTSLSINILDSILWAVAIDLEVEYIENMTDENIHSYREQAEEIQRFISNIQPRIDKLKAKKDRLREMYVDGMSKETYDKKNAAITEEMNEVKAEEMQYIEKLQRINDDIENLKNYKQLKAEYHKQWLELLNGERIKIDAKDEHSLLRNKISNIVDDKERHDIIHRHIKSVYVTPKKVNFPFKVGRKDISAKEIKVRSYRDTPLLKKKFGELPDVYCFFVIPCGGFNGKGALILDVQPDLVDEDSSYFYCYDDKINHPYEEIQEDIYIDRFYDTTKRKNRAEKRKRKINVIDGRLTIAEVAEKYGISYSTVFNRIKKGKLNAEYLYGQYYITSHDADMIFEQ